MPLAEPWFHDPDTQRWLGGSNWPEQLLDLASQPLGEFRGAVETGRYRWLAWEGAKPVGYIDCGTYDRLTVWDGGPGERGVVDSIDVPDAAVAFVVDPGLRRRGYCAAMVLTVMTMPQLMDVRLFTAGVAPANAGSVACLRRAGFQTLSSEPDWEGIVYYGRYRDPPGASS